MKRFILNSMLFVLGIVAAWAQKPDFDLYFANNVTEVANFDEIKSPNSGLRWTQVQTAEGDMSGNYVEHCSMCIRRFGSIRKNQKT